MSQQHEDGLRYTDISFLILEAQDAFDIPSWGLTPEREPSRPQPKETPKHIEIHKVVEHEMNPEVAEYVKNEAPTAPEVDQDLAQLGVEAVQDPVQYPTHEVVHVPLSDDQIVQAKKLSPSSAFRWLAEWCLYLLRRANIRLKIAHGKAERIMEKPV